MWPARFGFRKSRSIVEAIFVARRRIELAIAQRSGRVSLLALDWAKAFDSVHIERMLHAMRRFGIPDGFCKLVGAAMRNRCFYVEEWGSKSHCASQRSGVSQGCTLSPLIFVIVMSIIMSDAVASLSPATRRAYDVDDLADLAFADDTLLIGISSAHVSEFLQAVRAAGERFGLELHDDKFQLIQIGPSGAVQGTHAAHITSSNSMIYLGSLLTDDGRGSAELSRRIGIARNEFFTLQRVWSQSNLTRTSKLRIYTALVESKLMYSLAALVLSAADRRRVDGFQARCLRRIWGIHPAFVSRVSNAQVRERCKHARASMLVENAQLSLLGKVLNASRDNPIRKATLIDGTTRPLTERFVRKVGRPRLEWFTSVADCARGRFQCTIDDFQKIAMFSARLKRAMK